MKKIALPLVLFGAAGLAGCATYDRYGYGNDPYGYGYGYPSGSYGYPSGGYHGRGGPDFAEAAAEACLNQAQRYGRAYLGQVRQLSRDTMRVSGTVDSSRYYGRAGFGCSFRADGRITDFDIGR